MPMNGSGFYALVNNELLYASTYVRGPNLLLHKYQRETYEYPVDGWTWFESEADARLSFGLPEYVDPDQTQEPPQ